MERNFNDVIFIAYPLGGKDTQANLLIEFYKKISVPCLYIATGDYFRNLEKSNYSALLMSGIMNSGNLVPDFLATGLVVNSLIQYLDSGKTLIFNGFPRSKKQGESFVEVMNFYNRKPIIILIKVSKEEILRRLSSRKEVESRLDDTESIVDQRLRVFDCENDLLLDFLKIYFKCIEIKGDCGIKEIHSQIIGAIKIK